MTHREELVKCFRDTVKLSYTDDELLRKTEAAKKNTHLVGKIKSVAARGEKNCAVSVTGNTVLQETKVLVAKGLKTVVINSASAVNPGGGVTLGDINEEANLCRSSNLYTCLKQPKLMHDFYVPNRIEKKPIYTNRLIYSKGITVFKSEESVPTLLPPKDRYEMDVLTCFLPKAQHWQTVDENAAKQVYSEYISFVLGSAYTMGAQAVVFGDFGSDDSDRFLELAANAFKTVVENQFLSAFSEIVFATGNATGKVLAQFSAQLLKSKKTELSIEEFYRWRENNPYYGKKFSILGDSMSALKGSIPLGYKPFYDGTTCEQFGVLKPEDMWWGKVISFFGGELLVNNAYAESAVTSSDGSFPAGFSQKRIQELETLDKTPDVVMVYMGAKDWMNSAPLKCTIQRDKAVTEYFDYTYINMLIAIQQRYPNAEVWCFTINKSIALNTFSAATSLEKKRKAESIEQFNNVIRSAAQGKNRKLVDVSSIPDLLLNTGNGTHLNVDGMEKLAQCVCACITMDRKMCENKAFYQQGIKSINPEIGNCKNNEHIFKKKYSSSDKYVYYCEICEKEIAVDEMPSLAFYRDMQQKYSGSTLDGEVLNKDWLSKKSSGLEQHKKAEDNKKQALYCTRCGMKIQLADKFCLKCGTLTVFDEAADAKICNLCNEKNSMKAVYCRSCGGKMKYEKTGSLKASEQQGVRNEPIVPEIIDDRYKIIRQVGKGSSSMVFLAQDMKLERICAVKMIKKNTYANAIAAQESLNEANKLKLLAHISIPQLYDVYDDEECLCVVMEYIEGKNLRTIIHEAHQPIEEDMLIDWGKQICNVLYYLHTMKPARIFRDLKPANIIVQPNGIIKLIDFGTMKNFDNSRAEDTVNLGTKGYAAPEQFGGKGATDARTDIYGFGMTMYHLVTGVNPSLQPFEVKPIREYRKDISKDFESIIMKCIQVEREQRYQSAWEIIMDLERLNWK